MTRGGHNRKPPELHILHGTGRPSRQKQAHPQPTPGRPTCPQWLLPEAKREWRRVAPELLRLGLLTIVDRAALAAYCQAWARWRLCEAVISAEGATVPGHRGVMRKHPLLPACHAYLQLMRAFAAELGLSPSSRGRLSVPPPAEPDALGRWLKGDHDGS